MTVNEFRTVMNEMLSEGGVFHVNYEVLNICVN